MPSVAIRDIWSALDMESTMAFLIFKRNLKHGGGDNWLLSYWQARAEVGFVITASGGLFLVIPVFTFLASKGSLINFEMVIVY